MTPLITYDSDNNWISSSWNRVFSTSTSKIYISRSYEGEIDMDLKLLGSEEFVNQRYQDTAKLIYVEWRQLTKCG